ncbi:MAG: benzoate-CoA ligase family protein [Planctomycetes bacterium]|nr:benzoate-CoA ligase family protein [Planctomycetota bacterium]
MKNILYPERLNVTEALLSENISKRADKTALYFNDQQITYKKLGEDVNRFGNVLKGLGIKPGERILLVLLDTPYFYYAFLGSIKYGTIPVPINTTLKKADYEFIIQDSQATTIITWEKSEAAQAKSASLKHTIFCDKPFDGLMAKASPELKPADTSKDDTAFWLYSSGSTGKPKGVLHRHRDILFTADTYAKEVLKISEKDIIFSASKLFFAYGLGNSLSFPLRAGASVIVFSEGPSPENVLNIVEKLKPTVFFGVPTLYNSMLKRMKGNPFSSVRICASAGEALPPEIYKKWEKVTGLEALDGIGSTEALHIFISNFPNGVKENSTGKTVPGYEAKIITTEGKELADGETGYLVIRGQSITPSYWNRPDENKAKIMADGWFNTGDMYSKENGYFFCQGRGDDMLKVGGIWVSPAEIENVITSHAAVHECAVVGHKVEGLVKPFAYAVLNQGYDKTEEFSKKLLAEVQEKLPKYKWPWEIRFVDSLPRTSTGKIQRFKLRNSQPEYSARS